MGKAAREDAAENRGALDADSGLYVVVLRLDTPTRLRVGALGLLDFSPGSYLYVGSARRNLRRRVARHLNFGAPINPRWHIDALTRAGPIRALGVVLYPAAASVLVGECALNRAVGQALSETHPEAGAVSRFGAGDCRQGCLGHLWHTPETVRLSGLVSLEGIPPGVPVLREKAPRFLSG